MTAKLMSEAATGLQFKEPPIFERGTKGRSGASISKLDVPEVDLQAELASLRRIEPAGLHEVSEPEAIRHFVRLSQWNFSIDTQFYPLGSCTMKHNPKVNEWAARLPGDRKSTRLNSSHMSISYAVFCLKKKKKKTKNINLYSNPNPYLVHLFSCHL